MSEELGEINYDERSKLIPSREDETQTPEIYLIETESKDGVEASLTDSVEIQTKFIAKKINELKDQNPEIDFKDIGVLFRNVNKQAKKIIEIFKEEGIPVIFNGDAEQIVAEEINLFLDLLSLIDNHKQDLPLLSILSLPIFGFTLDERAKIRLAFPDEKYYFRAAENYRDTMEDELSIKLKDFYEKLDNWREESKHLELDEFLWNLLLESGFYDYYGSFTGGKEKKRNLRILVDRAISYKNSSLKGLASFLQYVSRLKKRGEDIASSKNSPNSPDAIQLMSIHKSKGLEFPILFVGDLQKEFNLNNATDIEYDKKLGYGARSIELIDDVIVKRDTLLSKAIHLNKNNLELSEEMRLLYVALTRAKDKLFLVGTIKNAEDQFKKYPEDISINFLKKKKSFLDWIMSALINDKNFRKTEEGFETDNWKLKVSNINQLEETIPNNIDEESVDIQKYLTLKEQIFKQLDKPIAVIEETKPLKRSVTQIKKHGIDEEETVDIIPLDPEERVDFNAADYGTAVHRLMQFTDLEGYLEAENKKDYIEKQKDLLVERGLIREEISEHIKINAIEDFLNSELGQRLLTAFNKNPDNVLKEMPFTFDIEATELYKDVDITDRPLQITGIIDNCFIEDGEWVLIDYKTDRIRDEQTRKSRLDEYSLQLSLYKKALEKLTNLKVKESHLYFLTMEEDILVNE